MGAPRVSGIQDTMPTADRQGRRIWVYPADSDGRFRARRTWVQAVLLLVLIALPWIRIGGHPALLFDIPNRRFFIFGLNFWAHDAPMLLFILAGAAVSLAFVTAVWGRVWCGWACPQTVFVDGLFRRIERFIEGDAVVRRRLDQGPWTSEKVMKKGIKWFLFTLISVALAHVFLAYFTGADHLARMALRPPSENPTSFAFMSFLALLVLFDFAWFREQFCAVVCPYGRFQSVLMNPKSMSIRYDSARGEPRRGADAAKQGDCVDCNRCVSVCPTGIDIRNGLQLECIACVACVDACDEVMTRIRKPKGLIRLEGEKGAFRSGLPQFAIMIVLALGLGIQIARREPVEVSLIRAIGSPYQEAEGGRVLNQYRVDLRSQVFEPQDVRIELPAQLGEEGFELVTPSPALSLAPGETLSRPVFFRFPRESLTNGKRSIRILIHTPSSTLEKEVMLVGPFS